MNAFCCSVNVDGMVNLHGGGGDTWTLHVVIKFVWIFCTHKWWGLKNLVLTCPHTPHTLVPSHPYASCALLSLYPLALVPSHHCILCPSALPPFCSCTLLCLHPPTLLLLYPNTLTPSCPCALPSLCSPALAPSHPCAHLSLQPVALVPSYPCTLMPLCPPILSPLHPPALTPFCPCTLPPLYLSSSCPCALPCSHPCSLSPSSPTSHLVKILLPDIWYIRLFLNILVQILFTKRKL